MEDQQLGEEEIVIILKGKSSQEALEPVKDTVARIGAHAQRGRRGLLSRKEMDDFIRLVQEKEAHEEEISFKLAADLAKGVWLQSHKDNLQDRPPDFSYKWLCSTLKRHGIVMTSPKAVEPERVAISTSDRVMEFLVTYQKLLKDLDIDPRLLWSMDEAEVRALTPRTKVAVRIGDPPPIRIKVNNVDPLTLVLFVSAKSPAMTPVILFPAGELPPLTEDLYDKFMIGASKNGRMEEGILRTLIEKIFLGHLKKVREQHNLQDRWALLITDNHPSRRSLTNEALFAEQKLKILYLPPGPHCSALLHPLNHGPKSRLRTIVSHEFQLDESEDADVNRIRKMKVASDALCDALSPLMVRNGWERSGLFPVDVDAVMERLGARANGGTQVTVLNPMAEENGHHN